MSHPTSRSWTLIALVTGSLVAASMPAMSAPPSSLRIDFDRNRQMIRIVALDTEVRELLSAISAETGLRVMAPNGFGDRVTVQLDFLPVEVALKRILEDRSYAIANVNGPPQEITVWLMSTPGTPQASHSMGESVGSESGLIPPADPSADVMKLILEAMGQQPLAPALDHMSTPSASN